MKFFSACMCAAALFLATPAAAQDAAYTSEHLALAREAVAVSGSDRMLVEMMEGLAPQMADQIVAAGAQRDVATRYVDIFMEEFVAETPQVLELTAIAYAGAFNEAQLRDLIAFYRSDTGRALVEKMPELSVALTRAGMVIGEQVAQRTRERLESETRRAPINP